MKKTLAIILTLVMIFGAVAFSTSAEEATPTVSIVTNKGSAVEMGTTTYFTVKFENFASIKGVDVTITADEAITLGTVESFGFKSAAGENVNYTETNTAGQPHVIRFVDLTVSEDARIVFEATVAKGTEVSGDPVINVTGKYALDGKTFFDKDIPATGNFELKEEIVPTVVEGATEQTPQTITAANKKFIPQGSVYKKISETEYVFADKNDDGQFVVTEDGYQYDSFDVPENKITTFGASNDLQDESTLRFGSYSELNVGGASHGTVIFEGDWLALKNHYIKKGYTVQQFVEALYKNAVATLEKPENEGKTFVTYRLGTSKINLYIFSQRNYMWKNDSGVLEYAIRLHGTKTGNTYTAVAFSKNGEALTFSHDVKSVTK